MGRTIPSFEMVIAQEIDRVMRSYGKSLSSSSKKEKELLYETMQLCENYSYACSKALKLVPMRSILFAIILDQEKQVQSASQNLEIMTMEERRRSE